MNRKDDCQHPSMKPTPADDGVGCTDCGRTWTIPEFIAWMQGIREIALRWGSREPLVGAREIVPPVKPNDSAGQDDCG